MKIMKLTTTMGTVYKVTEQPGNWIQCVSIEGRDGGDWFVVKTKCDVIFVNPIHVVEIS